VLGGFPIDEGGIFLNLSDPLGGPLFGLEQLLHGHRLVDMVLGLGDLSASDQEPHIGVHQVLRSSATSRVKLRQGDLRCGQALLRGFFTNGQRRATGRKWPLKIAGVKGGGGLWLGRTGVAFME
jgi:hypothetical protein